VNFRSAGFLAQPRPPGRGRFFGAATPPRARQVFWRSHAPRGASTCKKSTCKKSNRYFFFAPHAACRRKVQRDLKILATLRTAVLQVPSKFYENRTVRSAFVHFLEIGVIKGPMRTGTSTLSLSKKRKIIKRPMRTGTSTLSL
jgi:hypothetical protein